MSRFQLSRRGFFSASAAAGAAVIAHPVNLAAQAAGVKAGDLPDLTIKEAKIYVTDASSWRNSGAGLSGGAEIASLVTASGIEGNFTLGNRGNPPGWVDFAKSACVGKNLYDILPTVAYIPNQTRPGGGAGAPMPGAAAGARGGAGAAAGARGGGGGGRGRAFIGGFNPGFASRPRGTGTPGPNVHAAACDFCLWDILGKAVNRPIYRILGGTKDRVLAYASSQHLAAVEDFGPDALKAKAAGLKAYKIHPGEGQRRSGSPIPAYLGHIEEIKEVRKAVGDDYTLLFDAVQRYNYYEALRVGRALDENGYVSFEDPMPTTDLDGLVELRKHLDVPTEVGEFILNIYDYGEYIRRDAMGIARLIADNLGGITGSFRVGQLADTFSMPCTPHNWGSFFDMAAAFQLELALPNCYWFEMPWPWEYPDRPYVQHKFRTDADGYVLAPTEPGMGYPLDRAALDKIMIRIDR
ncbi:MAG: mandelate racemase/muconate lactonizing enzyme family protein [Bryobacteraceae bacterium]